MVEQIVMRALGKEFDPLWLVSCAADPPAHFHRDHRVLRAVQDENRRLDEAAELFSVLPDGSSGSGGRRAWFMPGRFKLCPACGEHHSDSTRDINRLAALSAEGRSSATTIIIAAILRWMNNPDVAIPEIARKLLAFTDNRQDAALQAGHFNDFIFVTLLRGAILGALTEAGDDGLREDQIGQAIQRMLGFVAANVPRQSEWLVEPDLKGANLLGAERTMREALTHRFWIDQRRGWRYTNPNLEPARPD